MQDMVVLLNYDGKASRSIARKLRAEGFYCKVLPTHCEVDVAALQEARGVIVVGGTTGEPIDCSQLAQLWQMKVPMLSLGDAALSCCEALGGALTDKTSTPSVVAVTYAEGNPIVEEIADGERYLPNMRYLLPCEECKPIASAADGVLGFCREDQACYAFAFQIENNDPDGSQLLVNFCQKICECTPWWSEETFVERAVADLERCSDGGEALCAISGGVDSAVAAVLGRQALGERLHCLFVDTGLLREGERQQVLRMFREEMDIPVTCIDASAEFLAALEGVSDPIEKDRIVFANLRAIIRREVSQLPQVRMIIQGTNYTDTLDSTPPFQLEGSRIRIVEPVRELFKDEIRCVAEVLHMPAEICRRQPFPGSGLATRMMQAVTKERLSILRRADAIFQEEIEQSGQNKRLWQYFAVHCEDPDPSRDGCFIVLRAVQSAEGDTGVAARLPVDLTERTTERIMQELPQVSRVLYDLTPSRSYARMSSM